MNEIFRFKQFQVDQQGCTMKINTDGVLLGAMAGVSRNQVKRILDVGTGTGVIAMMLAQRYDQALVDAADIDEGSFECSRRNFHNSSFANRMKAYHIGIEEYETSGFYDLIVSNPPFFLDSLKSVSDRKSLSRHGSLLFYRTLFERSAKWLAVNGSFVIVWPVDIRDRLTDLGYTNDMNNYREVFIQSFPESKPFRVISFFTNDFTRSYTRNGFHIYQERGKHSEVYVELLKDFFLNF